MGGMHPKRESSFKEKHHLSDQESNAFQEQFVCAYLPQLSFLPKCKIYQFAPIFKYNTQNIIHSLVETSVRALLALVGTSAACLNCICHIK